jgi:uncharacterized membrane protein
VGNIVTAAFWKIMADRRGDPAIVHQAANADWFFTVPGLVLLIVSGSLMAERAGYAMNGLNWLTLSLILFGLTGLLWLAALIPLQRAMIRRSEESVRAGALTEAYRKASRQWAVFGTVATLLPVVVLYLMIAKTNIG